MALVRRRPLFTDTHKQHDFGNFENENAQVTPRKYEIVYPSLIFFLYVHAAGLYGGYLAFTKAKWTSIFFTYTTLYMTVLGIAVGAHRLWSHRSFKAKPPLEIFLMICNSMACQNSAYNWVRDHRLHHKCSDTDGDPHNASRGFFFSHIGWLIVKKHPEVKRLGATIVMDDIRSNPILSFQKKNAKWFLILVGFVIPTIIPVLLWNEALSISWHLVLLRYIIVINLSFIGNSALHIWGYKPYDKKLRACQNLLVTILTYGEGFHNFHHTFPNDYRSSEKGNYKLNLNALFVDVCAKLGLAYDLKEVSEESIMKRKSRTGDGSGLWGAYENLFTN